MNIVYKKGDLFDGDERFIAHGCNSFGAMGAGFARQLKNRLPWAFRVYREKYETEGLTLGNVVVANGGDKTVFNIISQATTKASERDLLVHVDYSALERGFRFIDAYFADSEDVVEVAMPKIGAGLAGGDWETIVKIIERTSSKFQPIVYEL